MRLIGLPDPSSSKHVGLVEISQLMSNVRCSRRAPVELTFVWLALGICVQSSRAWKVRALAAERGR